MSSSKCTVETKLSDEKCLVVQFINERQKPVQVGFQAWLKERNTKSNLHHLLDSEVIIRWPIKEDIKCARMMEKILKKKDIIWEDLVVRVRSVGTFIDMCQHVKNIELFGVPNPSREERRKLCKKPSCSEPEDLDSSDLDSSVQNNNTITSAKVDKPPPPKKQKTKALTVKKNNALLQSQIENLSRDFIKKTSQIDLIDDIEEEEEEEENDEDSSMFKWSKDRLVDLISTLKVENKKLREDNARLRALRAISEDLHKMTVMSSTLCKDMAKLRRDMDSVLIKDGRSSRNSNNSSDKNSNNNSKPSHSNRNLQKDNNNISNKANNTVDAIERHSEVHADRSTITEADAYEPQLHHNQSLEQQLLPTIAHTEEQLLPTIAHTEEQLLPTIAHTEEQLLPTIAHTEQPVQLQNERPAKENVTDFAGRKVETEKLKRLSRSKLSIFTTSIMDLIFTDEEMATSSMTGIMSNFSRGKNKLHMNDVKAKPELNPPVKKAVMEYIAKEFNCPADGALNKAVMGEIFKAMKSKLNNKSNTWRNKRNQEQANKKAV